MSERPLFRKAALDRLSSPDQLDRLMHVTTPQGWLTLAALGLVVLGALGWAVLGRVPTSVNGTGLLLTAGGLREVDVLGGGVVRELLVRPGDRVEAGDRIAVVGQPQLEQQVALARDRLGLLEEERRRRTSFTSANVTLETEALDRERSDLTRRREVAADRIDWLETRIRSEEEARRLGLLTGEDVQATLRLLEDARSELASLEIELQNNELRRLLLRNRAEDTLDEMDERIREAQADLEALELNLRESSLVVSPYTGTIREVRSDVGQLIGPGQAIVSLEMVDAPLQAILFVPAEGKRVQAGMPAQISPVTVRREEFGFIRGRVGFVSAQPVTPQAMRRTLGNDLLVDRLTAQGATFMVEVELERDPDTISGFRWSSPGGPPLAVETGTLLNGWVVVAEQRPISLVLPIFRSALGLTA